MNFNKFNNAFPSWEKGYIPQYKKSYSEQDMLQSKLSKVNPSVSFGDLKNSNSFTDDINTIDQSNNKTYSWNNDNKTWHTTNSINSYLEKNV